MHPVFLLFLISGMRAGCVSCIHNNLNSSRQSVKLQMPHAKGLAEAGCWLACRTELDSSSSDAAAWPSCIVSNRSILLKQAKHCIQVNPGHSAVKSLQSRIAQQRLVPHRNKLYRSCWQVEKAWCTQCCDHCIVFRSTPSFTRSHSGLMSLSFLTC